MVLCVYYVFTFLNLFFFFYDAIFCSLPVPGQYPMSLYGKEHLEHSSKHLDFVLLGNKESHMGLE